MKTKKMKAKNKDMSTGLGKPAKRCIDMKGKWKTIDLDPSVFSEEGLEGLVCFEELTDYRLINSEEAAAKAVKELKREKKKKAQKRKAGDGEEAGAKGDSENKEGESTSEPAKKKAKKKRKNKKGIATESENISAQVVKQKDNAATEGGEDEVAGEADENDSAAITADPKDAKRSRKKKKKGKGQQTVQDTVPEEQPNPESSSDLEKEKSSQDKVTKAPHKKAKNWTNAALSGSEDKNVDMSAWKDLFVPPPVLRALSSLGFGSPTPIQALCLPPAIRDRMDILGAAETGKIKVIGL